MRGRPLDPSVSSSSRTLGPAALCVLVAACSSQAPAPAPAVSHAPAPTPAAAPTAEVDGGPVTATAIAEDPGSQPDAGAVLDAGRAGVDAAPRPRVKVVTIGMHVGGGPYDEITKEPLRRSVEPRFADLAACWRHAPSGTGTIDAGVDLVVEAGGGRAKVSNPRSLLKNDAFVACVVAFFESVEFQKPRNGRTTVSYSVRFTP